MDDGWLPPASVTGCALPALLGADHTDCRLVKMGKPSRVTLPYRAPRDSLSDKNTKYRSSGHQADQPGWQTPGESTHRDSSHFQ